MGTIVSSLANYYYDLYMDGVFNEDAAIRIIGKCDDLDRRIQYIKSVYETIMGSSIINETTKIFIKSRKSYMDVARYYNCLHEQEIKRTKEAEDNGLKINSPVHAKTEALVKADICYTNKKLKNVLYCEVPYCNKRDWFNVVLWKSEMEEHLWLKAEEALELLKAMCNGSLLSKELFWLNIPAREFHKELTEQEFNHLVELIKPYFTVQKSLAQKELNSLTKEAGYLNYILRADMDLNNEDAGRRDIIMALANGKPTVTDNQSEDDPEVAMYRKQLAHLINEDDVEKAIRVDVMSKIGLIHYRNKDGIFTEKENNLIEALGAEYERLKKIDIKRKEDIQRLQEKIDRLMEERTDKVIAGDDL